MKKVTCTELPETPQRDTVYELVPRSFDWKIYKERTDRNLGWIMEEDQEIFHRSTVGIAGCGGMGGLIAPTFLRLGVGKIIIFEPENFDLSNINRQYGAKRGTIGKSKAFETARMIREIYDDTTLIVCAQGLTEENVDVLGEFVKECDLIFDEIEFWALGARMTLHKITREMRIPLINCNTIGFRSYLSYFSSEGRTLEDCMDISYRKAWDFQKRIQKNTASEKERKRIKHEVMKIFIPEVPEYSSNLRLFSTVQEWERRLLEEGKANVISPNPVMAAGWAADHGTFQLLKKSPCQRNFTLPPEMPGYLMMEVGYHKTRIVTEQWW